MNKNLLKSSRSTTFYFLTFFTLQLAAGLSAMAQESAENTTQETNNASIQEALDQLRKSNALPFPVPMMMQPPPYKEWVPNTVIEEFPAETRVAMLQNMAAANPWSLRQVFNFMTLKMKANEDLSFDDVIEAMDSQAVEENLKRSGHNMVWKEVEAKTGKPTPRFEILQYCDALVARMVLDYSPEFSIFLPCRISVLEDAVGDIWLMTLDWDVSWLSFVWHPDSQLDEELKENGRRIRNAMVSIMEAGASGDW
ncbi:MAG: DUF302 domain-containing protein [Arenicellales bacterium]